MNKKAIIIGNGPSLAKVNIDDLREVDTFSFNRAYLSYEDWDFYPTYYAFVDRYRISLCYDEIHELLNKETKIKKFILASNEYTETHFAKDPRVITINKDKFQWIRDSSVFGKYTEESLPKRIEPCPHSIGSVAITALNFLYVLGYDEVGMVGVDARYVKDSDMNPEERNVNHYREDYIPGESWSDHNVGNDLAKWRVVKSNLDVSNKLKLYSCTENSRVNGIIPYKSLDEFLRKKNEN